jgi:hypothetical protein
MLYMISASRDMVCAGERWTWVIFHLLSIDNNASRSLRPDSISQMDVAYDDLHRRVQMGIQMMILST